MFDISFGELMIIGAVALVVIGPERLPRVARLLVSEVGAVIGAHAGTGLLGIVVVPRRDGARR